MACPDVKSLYYILMPTLSFFFFPLLLIVHTHTRTHEPLLFFFLHYLTRCIPLVLIYGLFCI